MRNQCSLPSRSEWEPNAIRLEFELDADELDDHSITQLETEFGQMESRRTGEQRMPLLVGLVDTSVARRSSELSSNGDAFENGYIDLEELAAKQVAGGNIVDSVANMANSILGAGE